MVSCKEYSLQDGWLAAMNCSSKEAERHRSQQAFSVFRTPEVDRNIDLKNQKSNLSPTVWSFLRRGSVVAGSPEPKGQLISKCPNEKSVSFKISTKIFLRFLPWKFTTSR